MDRDELSDSIGAGGEDCLKEDVPTCVHSVILTNRRWIEVAVNYDEKEWKLEETSPIDRLDQLYLTFECTAVSPPSSVLFDLHIPFTTITIPVELRGGVARFRVGALLSTRLFSSGLCQDTVLAQRRSSDKGREEQSVYAHYELCLSATVSIRTVNDSFGHRLTFFRGVRIQGQTEGIPSEVSTLHASFIKRLLYGDFKWKDRDWSDIQDLAGEELTELTTSLFMPVLIETPIGRVFCRQLRNNKLFGMARLLGMFWCPPSWLRERIAKPEGKQFDFIDLDKLLENSYVAEMLETEITLVHNFFRQLDPDQSIRDLHIKLASRFSALFDKLNIQESEGSEVVQETATGNGQEEEGEKGIATPLGSTPKWSDVESEPFVKVEYDDNEVPVGLKRNKRREVKRAGESLEVQRPSIEDEKVPEKEEIGLETAAPLPLPPSPTHSDSVCLEWDDEEEKEEKANSDDNNTEWGMEEEKEGKNTSLEEEERKERGEDQSDFPPTPTESGIDIRTNEEVAEEERGMLQGWTNHQSTINEIHKRGPLQSVRFNDNAEFDWHRAALNAPVFVPMETPIFVQRLAKKNDKIEENQEIEQEIREDPASSNSGSFPATPTLSEIEFDGNGSERSDERRTNEEYQQGRTNQQSTINEIQNDSLLKSARLNDRAGFDEGFDWRRKALNAPVFIPSEAKKEEIVKENREIEKNEEETRETREEPVSSNCGSFPPTPTLSEIDQLGWKEEGRKEETTDFDSETNWRIEQKKNEGMDNGSGQRDTFHFSSSIANLDVAQNEKVEESMEQRELSPNSATRNSLADTDEKEDEQTIGRIEEEKEGHMKMEEEGRDAIPVQNAGIDVRMSEDVGDECEAIPDPASSNCGSFPPTPTLSQIDYAECEEGGRMKEMMGFDEEETTWNQKKDERRKNEGDHQEFSPKSTTRPWNKATVADKNEEEDEYRSMDSEYYSVDGASESEEKTTVDTVLPEKKKLSMPKWID